MHKTIYIDVDEEITSIVDRIKSEEASNIVLVVPKNAMLTQGVINLKLLKKEIERGFKTSQKEEGTTNDKHARAVIERLEIKTKEARGDLTEKEAPKIDKDIIAKKASSEALEMIGDTSKAAETTTLDEIGTESFFEGKEHPNVAISGLEQTKQKQDKIEEAPIAQTTELESQPKVSEEQKAPPKPSIFKPQQLKETLYAKKHEKTTGGDHQDQTQTQPSSKTLAATAPVGGPAADMKPPVLDMAATGKTLNVKNENPGKRDLFGNIKEEEEKLKTSKGYETGGNYSAKKAEKFFSHEKEVELEKEAKKELKEEKKKKRPKSIKFWIALIILMGLIGAIAATVSWAYINYPKVNVSIYPKSKDVSKEIKIVAKEGIDSSEISENEIPGKLVEMMISKSLDYDATGETYETDDGKARGKVKILNNYSQSTQQLVATTRLLSTDGKLFRLVNDIVVPGMDGETPGEIEAAVIADKPGPDFNIGPSKFTIEGFKGGPKYTAFEVISERSMTDGGSPDDNKKMTMVTETDIANARIKTIESLEQSLESEIESKLEDDLKVIVDSVEKEIESTKSSREPNEVAANFSYTVDQKVKAIAFFAEDVNFVVMSALEKDVEEDYIMDSISEVTFKKGIADYEKKSLTMYVDASAVSWPLLNQTEIIEGIAGKNENEIKSFLSSYQNIEKAERR